MPTKNNKCQITGQSKINTVPAAICMMDLMRDNRQFKPGQIYTNRDRVNGKTKSIGGNSNNIINTNRQPKMMNLIDIIKKLTGNVISQNHP